jgi:hypothetical protein
MVSRSAPVQREGAKAMAKSQKRSNREPKKPKADKKKVVTPAGPAPIVPGKAKPGAGAAGKK